MTDEKRDMFRHLRTTSPLSFQFCKCKFQTKLEKERKNTIKGEHWSTNIYYGRQDWYLSKISAMKMINKLGLSSAKLRLKFARLLRLS
jgi:hypothetical protein